MGPDVESLAQRYGVFSDPAAQDRALGRYLDSVPAPEARPSTLDRLSQIWPARLAQSVYSAATLPGEVLRNPDTAMDVLSGARDMSQGTFNRATDLASIPMVATSGAPAGALGSGPVRPGIRAYHGSPHDFDRFDMSRIGTGEGAQAYGRGLYFAENEAVARGYRDSLSPPGLSVVRDGKPVGTTLSGAAVNDPRNVATLNALIPDPDVPSWIKNSILSAVRDFDARAGAQATRDQIEQAAIRRAVGNANFGDETMARIRSDISRGLDSMGPNVEFRAPGRMYEVNLRTTPERLLDWDAPIARQPEAVQLAAARRLEQVLDDPRARPMESVFDAFERGTMRGDQIYGLMGRGTADTSAAALRDAGIDGIRYFDQGSRALTGGEILGVEQGPRGWLAKVRVENRGGTAFDTPTQSITTSRPYATREEAEQWARQATSQGTRNYVMFDDALIDILRKYGLAGLTAGTGAAAAVSQSRDN